MREVGWEGGPLIVSGRRRHIMHVWCWRCSVKPGRGGVARFFLMISGSNIRAWATLSDAGDLGLQQSAFFACQALSYNLRVHFE